MFGRMLPIFLLIFLIICFLVIVWLHGRKDNSSPNKDEGFQTTGSGSRPPQPGLINSYRYKGSGSGSGSTVRYPSQLDYPDTKYKRWDDTPYDTYYNTYEENETISMATTLLKFKDLVITKETPPLQFGSILSTFDSETPSLPWDYDNKDQNMSDIVWGQVSQEASKSLFLKNWIQTAVSNTNNMQPCGEGSANFCYYSPLLGVSTTDTKLAVAYSVADISLQNIGGVLSAQLAMQNSDGGMFGNTFTRKALSESFNGKFLSIAKTFYPSGVQVPQKISTTLKTLGHAESVVLGPRKILQTAKQTLAKLKVSMANAAKAASNAFFQNSSKALATVDATAATAELASLANFKLNPVLTSAALLWWAIAISVHLVFGFMGMFIMTLTTIIGPIVSSVFKPGGVCPGSSKRVSQLVSKEAATFINNFMPIGMLIETFDPYVCWTPEPPFAHLMIPPKMPDFMADRTLSLTYHSAWLSGQSANIPNASRTTFEVDPLPPGYKWLKDSDLAESSKMNDIVQLANSIETAKKQAGSALGSALGSIFSGSASGSASQSSNIAVSDCPPNTKTSLDGMTCNASPYKTNVKRPVLSACPANNYDDGFNCWATKAAVGNCRGGEFTINSSTTWDNTKGFMNPVINPIICTNADGTETRSEGTNNSNITVWANNRITCPNDADGSQYEAQGLLCYKKCQTNYTRSGAICSSSVSSVNRDYIFATHSIYSEQIKPKILKNLGEVTVPYCDFSKEEMLDRMAQFYYENSLANPKINEDGTITVQMITGFKGVTASSELSCDVACIITFMTYDPISGEKYSTVVGCASSYMEDPTFNGCPFCYRRFYFVKGPSDTQGLFTVTGCTNTDYTALDAMVLSSDPNSNPLQSVPKVWEKIDKEASIMDVENLKRNLASGAIEAQMGQGLLNVALMVGASAAGGAIGGRLGAAGGMVGGVVGGLGASLATSMWLDKVVTDAMNMSTTAETITDTVNTFVTGTGSNLSVVSNDNWWTINQGKIYENSPGYAPIIRYCNKSIVSSAYCANKYVVRDMVNQYHNKFQNAHIRKISQIEPRGIDGCYYKFTEVEFNPATNLEGVIEIDKEIILSQKIKDYATCTYEPVSFMQDMTNPSYPIRSYIDPMTITATTKKVIYPNRDTIYTSDLIARFVRVRPPITGGDGYLNLTQISVFDISGINISVAKKTYSTSVAEGAASSESVISGSTALSNDLTSSWQSGSNNRATEYWEVDLGKNINISEVVYIGTNFTNTSVLSGSSSNGRNAGVRIEFLYSNLPTTTPIYTVTLPNDQTVQYIPVYSSMYTAPSLPMAGPIQIPRPVSRGIVLYPSNGCVNKCEDRDIIDSMITQYNTNNTDSEIIKVLSGITSTRNSCEYKAEILIKDNETTTSSDGTENLGKSSIIKQYLTMPLTVKSSKNIGRVFGRYIKIVPSFTPTTVLQISNIIVWSAIPDGTTGAMKPGYIISSGKPTSMYNELYEINQLGVQPLTKGSTPARGPGIFRARDNNPETFFQIDLGATEPISQGSTTDCRGVNQEIYQIQFISQSDMDSIGIKNIEIQIYADRPDDQTNCCNGTYPPIWRYYLPNNDSNQMIRVTPPSQCTFNLGGTTTLQKPIYLLDNTPPFKATDTSGGVFTFSGIVDSLRSTWGTLSGSSGILPLKSEDLVTPVESNIKEANAIVENILETVASSQNISNTSKKCNDADVMSAMMTAYNIAKGPKDTDEYAVEKYTMNRILKAGQSTPTTCDVLFEEMYELYEDYMTDITDSTNKGTIIKAVRFNMTSKNNTVVPYNTTTSISSSDSSKIIITDLSSNALGILTNVSTVTPPFSGPTYAVDCLNPAWLPQYKNKLESIPRTDNNFNIRSTFKTINSTFQTTPLSCEYIMTKDDLYTDRRTNVSFNENDVTTYAKALFTLGSDGKTVSFNNIIEFNPSEITFSSDNVKSYLNGVETTVPNLYFYEPTKKISKRVNTTILPF